MQTFVNRIQKYNTENPLESTKFSLKTESSLLSESSRLSAIKTIDRANKLGWRDNFLVKANEDAKGLALASINNLRKQAKLHLTSLEQNCNMNTGSAVVKLLQENNVPAKPFAICKESNQTIKVAASDFNWLLQSIDDFEDKIPAEHLHSLTLLAASGVKIDSSYIGVPYTTNKPTITESFLEEVKSKTNNFKLAISIINESIQENIVSLGELVKMEDPILVVGFGEQPVVLIEIGRWL